jgi:hypothetical protein
MNTDEAEKPVPTLCPQCQGMRIVTAAVGALGLPIFHQGELLGVGEVIDHICAVVCVQCGHITFFAKSPRKVRQALEVHPQEFQEAALWFSQPQNH